MKIFQIVEGICKWETGYVTIGEAYNIFPEDLLFVEAPDYVYEGWAYREKDDNGNELTGDDRFIVPDLPKGLYYDPDTGSIYDESEVEDFANKAKVVKQNENKTKFAEFLKNNPLVWKDGKKYGSTIDDQFEMQLNMENYRLMVEQGVDHPVLKWHSVKSEAVEWNIDDMQALLVDIAEYIEPYFTKMNEYKAMIYACRTKDEVMAIDIEYSL